MEKLSRARYTAEFKNEAVRLVAGGERVVTVAENLGVPVKTLANWVHDTKTGKGLSSPERPVSEEQMEISRLKTKLASMKMERDILKKRRSTSRGSRREVRRNSAAQE